VITYSSLKTSIGNWLPQDNLSTFVDDFIDIAEARFTSRIMAVGGIRAMEATTTLTCSTSVDTIALPTGFVGLRGIYLDDGNRTSLTYNTPEQLNSQRSTTGKPRYFSVVGSNIQFNCIPDSAYTISITYYGAFTALSDSNTSNWLTTNAPQLLLQGSLQAASEFNGDDEAAAKWASLFQQSIDEVKMADEMSKYGPAPAITSERAKW